MWRIAYISSILGAAILIFSFFGSSSSPQQAAGASIAIGLAVIPYCIARSSSELEEREKSKNKEEVFE